MYGNRNVRVPNSKPREVPISAGDREFLSDLCALMGATLVRITPAPPRTGTLEEQKAEDERKAAAARAERIRRDAYYQYLDQKPEGRYQEKKKGRK